MRSPDLQESSPISTPRKVGRFAATVSAVALAASPILPVNQSEAQAYVPPTLPPVPVGDVFHPCILFDNMDQALVSNPVDPAEYTTQIQQLRDGEARIEDAPYELFRLLEEHPEFALNVDTTGMRQEINDLKLQAGCPEVEVFPGSSPESITEVK